MEWIETIHWCDLGDSNQLLLVVVILRHDKCRLQYWKGLSQPHALDLINVMLEAPWLKQVLQQVVQLGVTTILSHNCYDRCGHFAWPIQSAHSALLVAWWQSLFQHCPAWQTAVVLCCAKHKQIIG
jgi:hypothetical protein